jgi:hypothetical protein
MAYYTAAKKKTQGFTVGTIFRVWAEGDTVYALKQNFENHPVTLKVIAIDNVQLFTYSKEMARRVFIKPSKDLEDVIEESIMLCEAAYC